ncbi:hypothetical protein EDD21DRAFT_384233 [Dissophora ornata]|nr:hypothetical protein EDD21DRAFT_384233 [Dissophora ornata]
MPKRFSDQQVAEFRECFNTFDHNSDGNISRRELHRLLHIVGHKANARDLEKVLLKYDVDQSGDIDFEEFMSLATFLIKNKIDK